jgi:heme/copper-type cytochrome/quinol oxidase subunit 1
VLAGKKEGEDHNRYPREPPQLPQYDISPNLKKLTLMFIGAMLINFVIAGICALGMRVIQTNAVIAPFIDAVDSTQRNVLFYSLLTSHGQVMFFGVVSMNTMWFAYYATSKWGRKPLSGMRWARASFWIMEAAVVMIFVSPISGFGAGWYNLMPLTFLPGTPSMTWSTIAVILFMIGDVLVGIAITIFCIVIISTILRGKIPVGTQTFGARHGEEAVPKEEHELKEKGEDPYPKQDLDHTHMEDLPAGVRWVSLLGINGWFTKKWRQITPAVPILLVAAFVTAMVQIVANPGLFVQLANGFLAIENPIAASNWLLTKNAWWFFGHPIVYFPLLIFLGAMYFFIPRYSKERVTFNKWNYRPWPFYFTFSVLVFSHHVFMDIPNPLWLQMVSQTASLGIVWPSALTIFTALLFIWRSKITWNITTRFFYAGVAGWAFGGFQGSQLALWGTDVYLHNTMSMPGHIHLMLLLGPLLMAFGVIYAIFPDLTKKHMSKNLGEIHFWLTIFGGFGLALLFTVLGMEGAIRREADMPVAFHWAMPWLLFFGLTIGISQLLFVYNFASTLRRKPSSRELEQYHLLHCQPTGMGMTKGG